MKIIDLTQNKTCLVDDEDFDWLNRKKWHYSRTTDGNEYASRNEQGKTVYMHRIILNLKDGGEYCDHINNNGLDNRKANLRISDNHLNQFNRKELNKNNTSGIKGVYWNKKNKKWVAQIMIYRKCVVLGLFITKEEAKKVRTKFEKKYLS